MKTIEKIRVFNGDDRRGFAETHNSHETLNGPVTACRFNDMVDRITLLEQVIQDTLWMARRYANRRQTYAPSMVNDALDKLASIGVIIADDKTLIDDGNSSASRLDDDGGIR